MYFLLSVMSGSEICIPHCSFKGSTSKPCNIPKLVSNSRVLTQPEDICNELNQYFSTIGEKLAEELDKKNSNDKSYMSCCSKSVLNSMFCKTTDKDELRKLIKNLMEGKSK